MQVTIDSQDQLLEYVTRAQAGESVTLVQSGQEVAYILPLASSAQTSSTQNPANDTTDLEYRWERMMSFLSRGLPLGAQPPTKNEMHER